EAFDLVEEEVAFFETARLIGSGDERQHRQKSFRFICEFNGHGRSQRFESSILQRAQNLREFAVCRNETAEWSGRLSNARIVFFREADEQRTASLEHRSL